MQADQLDHTVEFKRRVSMRFKVGIKKGYALVKARKEVGGNRRRSMSHTLSVPPSGRLKAHAFRLNPDDSLKDSLKQYAQVIFAREREQGIESLFMITAVGSLKDVTLRLANASKTPSGIDSTDDKNDDCQNDIRRWSNQRFEIVSLVGTFSPKGDCHLHLSISNANGETFGGHLIEGKIFTTCEVVLGTAEKVSFPREFDETTGYNELAPKQIQKNSARVRFCQVALPFLLGFAMNSLISQGRRKRL